MGLKVLDLVFHVTWILLRGCVNRPEAAALIPLQMTT
jgi:hypothetical protein